MFKEEIIIATIKKVWKVWCFPPSSEMKPISSLWKFIGSKKKKLVNRVIIKQIQCETVCHLKKIIDIFK